MERSRSTIFYGVLNPSLWYNSPPRDDTLGRNSGSRVPEVITIEDDDSNADDVGSEDDVQVSASEGMPFSRLREEDLELRLGNKAFHKDNRGNQGGGGQCSGKAKRVKLYCIICMDTMKEEESTTCGHLFCKPCITKVVRIQKRCPSCQNELQMGNIHRIYLPGETS